MAIADNQVMVRFPVLMRKVSKRILRRWPSCLAFWNEREEAGSDEIPVLVNR